jgi:GTP-binding protein
MKTRQFVDTCRMHVRAGNGGNGSVSFRREKFVPKGGPDGGDGGRGGNVILIGDEDVDFLVAIFFDPQRFAEHGGSGQGRRKHGADGADLFVPVPLGTVIKNEETDEIIGEITSHGEYVIVAKGGKGGLGNVHWKRPDHQVPYEYTPGTEGEEFYLRLDLKVMAEAGFVGFPSAGKSSLLRCITSAKPKVGAYHFTTLNPIIGTVVFPEKFTSFRVADIPGLIENAHLGVGLGHSFLRHIERSKVLVFVIDMAGTDGREPIDDYNALLHELEMRDPELLKRKRIIVANKMDIEGAKEKLAEFREKSGEKPIEISATENKGTKLLVSRLERIIKPQPKTTGRNVATVTHKQIRMQTLGARTLKAGVTAKATTEKPIKERAQKTGRESSKGYTPPRELGGRGENPTAEDVISEEKLKKASSFLKF